MQIDADSDGRVTWEELLTFLLQKDSGGDEEGNRFLPDVGYVPPPHSQQHTGQVTQLVAMPDKDKYLTLGRDGQMKAWNHDGFWQPMDTLRDKRYLQNLWEIGNPPWKS